MSQNRQCPLCTQALEDFLFSVPGARSLRQLCEKFPFPKTSLYITCRTTHIIFHFKILSVFSLLPESWQSVQQKRSFLVGKMCTKRKTRRGQIHSQTHLPGYDWSGTFRLRLVWSDSGLKITRKSYSWTCLSARAPEPNPTHSITAQVEN